MMCTVQVVLLPEVFSSRKQSTTATKNICRRLFAADDDDVTVADKRAHFLSAVHQDLENRNRDRWNFDFRTETPLPGQFHWMPLRPKTILKDSNVANSKVPLRDSNTVSEQRPNSATLKLTKKLCKMQSMTQSKITDFLFHRKRQRTPDECCSVSKLKSRRLVCPVATVD